MSKINYVDICCGLAWGDEAKGKIVSLLAKTKRYDFVCRWAGGNNAGHTIYKNGIKYKTHLIPSGIFYDIKSIIGPDCVINQKAFLDEINYLKENNFDINLIKVSPKTHVILEKHIEEDLNQNVKTQGSTAKGIAPCYSDKYARKGILAKDLEVFKNFIWDEKLYGNILCEGAQGFWLDINHGNYPYVTSSTTLPYGSCSLGYPPQLIRNIYGATKIYDTRAGLDPEFPESLLKDKELSQLSIVGEEIGTTTGRKRKSNWLNLDKLVKATNISGTTHVIMSKIDILKNVKLYKLIYNNNLVEFDLLDNMTNYIKTIILQSCPLVKEVIFSDNHETINYKF